MNSQTFPKVSKMMTNEPYSIMLAHDMLITYFNSEFSFY